VDYFRFSVHLYFLCCGIRPLSNRYLFYFIYFIFFLKLKNIDTESLISLINETEMEAIVCESSLQVNIYIPDKYDLKIKYIYTIILSRIRLAIIAATRNV
jgi:hypothetical protein